MPKISIIIPLYNKERFIARALNSVLEQTFTDYEVIVINDGSTDKGSDIVQSFNDPRIYLVERENAGPGAARNIGTSLSDAELITYLDADDQWLSGFLEKSIEKLSENPECDVITSSFYIGPNKVNRWDILKKHGVIEGPWRLPLEIEQDELSYALAVFHTCSSIYKRTTVEKYDGFYSKNRCNYGEDVYLWLQIMLNHTLYRNSEPLAWYHDEDSQLGLSSQKPSYPIEPCLFDMEPLRRNCPKEYIPLLERWLAHHALRAARLNIELRDINKARYLLKVFPLIKNWKKEYYKLKLKIFLPFLIPYVRKFGYSLTPYWSKLNKVQTTNLQ